MNPKTTTLYRSDAENGGDWVGLERSEEWRIMQELGVSPVAATWQPLEVNLFREVGETLRPLRGSRMPCLGLPHLVLRDEAIESIGPFLEPFGELLPLACSEARLMLFHVTTVLDALDERASVIERTPEHIGGRVIAITHYAFRSEVIRRPSVFKLPQDIHGEFLLTDDIVSSIESFHLGGTTFLSVGDA